MSKQKTKKKTFITGADINDPKARAFSAVHRDRKYSDEEHGFVKHNRLYEKILFIPENEKYYQKVNEIYGITPGVNVIGNRSKQQEKTKIQKTTISKRAVSALPKKQKNYLGLINNDNEINYKHVSYKKNKIIIIYIT